MTRGRKYGARLDKYLQWVITTIAGAAFSVFVALVIYFYRWMDSVKENHLTHIQTAVEKTATAAVQTNAQLLELSIREGERYAAQQQEFSYMRELIRTRGL